MKFNLYQSFHVEREVVEKLDAILSAIHKLEEKIMAAFEDITALLTAIDTETNLIAARIQSLIDQIGAGLTPAQAETIQIALQGEVAKLTALAADPTNPIP